MPEVEKIMNGDDEDWKRSVRLLLISRLEKLKKQVR